MAQRDRFDIDIYQGDDEAFFFTITNLDDGTEYNFGSATNVKFSVKQDLSDSTALFSQNLTDGYSSSSWTNGTAAVLVTSENTALLQYDGWYDLQVTKGGVVTTVGWGKVNVRKQVG